MLKWKFEPVFKTKIKEIKAKTEDGTDELTWSEVNNLPYTAKVSNIDLLLSVILHVLEASSWLLSVTSGDK